MSVTSAPSTVYRLSSTVPAWLTVEAVLWALVVVVAVGLRLFKLDATPLNLSEAQESLAAWRFVQSGETPPAGLAYSPALFAGQALFFLLMGASDVTARLWPALAGSALALAPLLLRRQIGRGAALATGGLLALSPTAVVLSRTASGEVLTALGSLLIVAGLWRVVQERDGEAPFALCTLFVGLALTLSSSPLAYPALIALISALALVLLVVRSVDPVVYQSFRRAWQSLRDPARLKLGLGVFVGSLVFLSTVFVWNIDGLGAMADLIVQWLDGFVIWPDDLGWEYPFTIVLVYELLILLLGGAGVLLTVLRPGPFPLFLVFWITVSLPLAILRSGHGPGDVLLVLLPWVCLGGVALDSFVGALRRYGRWQNEGLFLALSLPLWASLWVNLTRYVAIPYQLTETTVLIFEFSLSTKLGGVVLILLLFILLLGALVLMQGNAPALRGLGLSTLVVLVLSTWGLVWGVSRVRPADPRELLLVEPTAPQVRSLVDSLARLSNERFGDAHAIDLTVEASRPETSILAWYLRDFQVLFVDRLGPQVVSSAIVAPEPPPNPSLGGSYVGQPFVLRREWRPVGLRCMSTRVQQTPEEEVAVLDCSDLFRWLLYRQSPAQPQEQKVILWVREDLWP